MAIICKVLQSATVALTKCTPALKAHSSPVILLSRARFTQSLLSLMSSHNNDLISPIPTPCALFPLLLLERLRSRCWSQLIQPTNSQKRDIYPGHRGRIVSGLVECIIRCRGRTLKLPRCGDKALIQLNAERPLALAPQASAVQQMYGVSAISLIGFSVTDGFIGLLWSRKNHM